MNIFEKIGDIWTDYEVYGMPKIRENVKNTGKKIGQNIKKKVHDIAMPTLYDVELVQGGSRQLYENVAILEHLGKEKGKIARMKLQRYDGDKPGEVFTLNLNGDYSVVTKARSKEKSFNINVTFRAPESAEDTKKVLWKKDFDLKK